MTTTAIPLIFYPLPLAGWIISTDKELSPEVREWWFWGGSILAMATPLAWKLTIPISLGVVGWYLSEPLRNIVMWKFRRQQLRKSLVSGLALTGTVVQSGIPFSSALEYVSQRTRGILKKELEQWVQEMHLSGSAIPSIKRAAKVWKIPMLSTLATTVSIATKSGGSLAKHLEEISNSLKMEIAHEEKIRTLTLSSRLQGYLSIPIPIFAFLLLMHFEPAMMKASLHDPLAQRCYILAISLQGFGALWILQVGRRK